MQQDEPNIELPALSDEDIHLLHGICRRASVDVDPPFKALFSAYDSVFAEEQIEPAHDGVVFRVLMRIGGRVKKIWTPGSHHSYTDILRDILEAQGITVVDDDGDDELPNGVLKSVEVTYQPKRRNVAKDSRRVSFDDAQLDSNGHSWNEDLSGPTAAEHEEGGLLSRPPKRGNGVVRGISTHKARSSSLDGHSLGSDSIFVSVEEQFQQSNGHEPRSLTTDDQHPAFQSQPTYDELLDHAEAFLETSTVRVARKCLVHWRSAVHALQIFRADYHSEAAAHDHRTLLKQALDIWHERALQRSHARKWEAAAQEGYKLNLMRKYFVSWHHSAESQRNAIAAAKVILLKIRYFKKWRALAIANASKARAVATQMALDRMVEVTSSRQHQIETAESHLGKRLVRKSFHIWFWQFCRNRVEGWQEDRLIQSGLARLILISERNMKYASTARQHFENAVQNSALRRLKATATVYSNQLSLSKRYSDNVLSRSCLNRWAIAMTLKRPEVRVNALITTNLQRKILTLMQARSISAQKARDFDRTRLLKTAWMHWNDALRQRALSQRINERALVESLYRWVLQERLAMFRRAAGQRLAQRVFSRLCEVRFERETDLESLASQFEWSRQRRVKLSVVVKLNIALNHREQGLRTATEFHNDHLIPRVLDPWLASVQKICLYEKWSKDAQLYFCGTKALKLWKSKASDQQHQRKKTAYTYVRIRVKKRLAKMCLGRLREARATTQFRAEEALLRAQARLSAICSNALAVWMYRQTNVQVMARQASDIDRHRLLTSATTAMTRQDRILQTSNDHSLAFRRESDLAVLFSALKKMQWYGFTAHRQQENAEALALRNREMHVRQMVRHWALEAQASQLSKGKDIEPDSPSLRPASRAASRLSGRGRQEPSTSADSTNQATPAYMRTPSRPRRATRFKPIPTPAPVTPFAFDTAYLATVPNPLAINESHFGPGANTSGRESEFIGLTPQITPFARKLKAGGVLSTPALSLRSGLLGRSLRGSVATGTAKSVRFARGRGSHVQS